MTATERMQALSLEALGGHGRAAWEDVAVRRSKNNRQEIWYIAGKRVSWIDAARRLRVLTRELVA